jgi:hypothetical protein
MEDGITIALQFKLAIGDVTVNEIIFRLTELRDAPMLRFLEEILRSYDDLICERLSRTRINPSKVGGDWGGTLKGTKLRLDCAVAGRCANEVIGEILGSCPRCFGN